MSGTIWFIFHPGPIKYFYRIAIALMKNLSDLRIVFFGTPDFAVSSLAALLEAGCQVVAVVTAPDKPAGRGQQLQAAPVKKFALQHHIPVLQPPKLKAPEFIEALQALQADVHVVVAFRMLPEVVWNMPPMGTINVHASLLPQYRGAAPINWAIINGEAETGVTTFKLRHEIDTGNMLLQRKVSIMPTDDAGTLHDKLAHEGALLLVATLEQMADGTLEEIPQTEDEASLNHAPKLFKETMRINWQQPAHQVHNFIRGLSPYPAAHSLLEQKNIRIYEAHIGEPVAGGRSAGDYETDGKTWLRFATADNWLYVDELQLEGKKRMRVDAFLRGFRLS